MLACCPGLSCPPCRCTQLRQPQLVQVRCALWPDCMHAGTCTSSRHAGKPAGERGSQQAGERATGRPTCCNSASCNVHNHACGCRSSAHLPRSASLPRRPSRVPLRLSESAGLKPVLGAVPMSTSFRRLPSSVPREPRPLSVMDSRRIISRDLWPWLLPGAVREAGRCSLQDCSFQGRLDHSCCLSGSSAAAMHKICPCLLAACSLAWPSSAL